MIKIIFLDIQ